MKLKDKSWLVIGAALGVGLGLLYWVVAVVAFVIWEGI
jgi:hypothetical protein